MKININIYKFLKIIIIVTIFFAKISLQANIDNKKQDDTVMSHRHSIYFEGSGNTLSISLNYEYMAFNKLYISDSIMSNLSFRVGTSIASIFVGPGGIVSMASWQIGVSHRLEIGTGILYAFGNPEDSWQPTTLTGTKSKYLITCTLGYKYVPNSKDWLIRIGFTPIISIDGRWLPTIGISYGWTL